MTPLLILQTVISVPMWLLIFYALYIQYERGGLWAVFKLFGIPGFLLDLVLNYVMFSAIFRAWPESGAYTFSKQLYFLQYRNGWRGEIARPIVSLLNAIAPSGAHIKA